jgi:transcriptional regulator with XRE-family HTH domain
MAAKTTQDARWLASERQALGLTGDALGGALGVAGNTILAVECGARTLTPTLRSRAEAFFAKKRLAPPPKAKQLGPRLVRVEAWISSQTLTAARAEAKKREVDLERVLGEWAARPR